MNAKQQALRDMRKAGLSTSFFYYEEAICGRKVWDGRCMNGGKNAKKSS